MNAKYRVPENITDGIRTAVDGTFTPGDRQRILDALSLTPVSDGTRELMVILAYGDTDVLVKVSGTTSDRCFFEE